MKLHIVAPRTGFVWVRQGIRTFWKQPLAMSGLFFLFMAWVSVASMVPVVGNVLALVLLPAMTLGLMAATAVAETAAAEETPKKKVIRKVKVPAAAE